MGFNWRQTDAFTDRLEEFGYQHRKSILNLPTARLGLGISRLIVPHVTGLLQVMHYDDLANVAPIGHSLRAGKDL